MEKALLEQLKEKLTIKKDTLEKELINFATEDKQVAGNWNTRRTNTEDTDMEEKADEVEEYDNLLSLEHGLETKLQAVNVALTKIAEGNYGICEKCNQEIEQERLLAYPEGKWCINCNK